MQNQTKKYEHSNLKDYENCLVDQDFISSFKPLPGRENNLEKKLEIMLT
jgi:hypothetical protein